MDKITKAYLDIICESNDRDVKVDFFLTFDCSKDEEAKEFIGSIGLDDTQHWEIDLKIEAKVSPYRKATYDSPEEDADLEDFKVLSGECIADGDAENSIPLTEEQITAVEEYIDENQREELCAEACRAADDEYGE